MNAIPSIHRALRRVTMAVLGLGWGLRALVAGLVLLEGGGGEAGAWGLLGVIGIHFVVTLVAAPIELVLALVLPWTAGAAARAEARLDAWGEDDEVPEPGRVAFDGIALWALIDAILTGFSITTWMIVVLTGSW